MITIDGNKNGYIVEEFDIDCESICKTFFGSQFDVLEYLKDLDVW